MVPNFVTKLPVTFRSRQVSAMIFENWVSEESSSKVAQGFLMFRVILTFLHETNKKNVLCHWHNRPRLGDQLKQLSQEQATFIWENPRYLVPKQRGKCPYCPGANFTSIQTITFWICHQYSLETWKYLASEICFDSKTQF